MNANTVWTHEGDYPRWCVVEYPGQQDEQIVIAFRTYEMAARYVTNRSAGRQLDIMKMTDNGQLTTEY